MERNVQNNGLVNLMAAVLIFIAAFAVTVYGNSLGGQVASVFLGLGALVAFVSWFQMRLEENERLEKLEVAELARSRGESALFEAKDSDVFPARRAREQFEKFFVPGFAVLLFILESGGAWLLWRWIGKVTTGIEPDRAMASLSLFAIFALVLFLLGRFSVTIARLEDNRLLRPGARFSAGGRLRLLFHRGRHRRDGGVVSKDRRVGRAGGVRVAGIDGGGNARHAVAGDLPAAREGKSGPRALRQPVHRAAGAAGEPVHRGGAGAGLSIRFQGFGNVVLPVAATKPSRAAAGATGGVAAVHLRGVH